MRDDLLGSDVDFEMFTALFGTLSTDQGADFQVPKGLIKVFKQKGPRGLYVKSVALRGTSKNGGRLLLSTAIKIPLGLVDELAKRSFPASKVNRISRPIRQTLSKGTNRSKGTNG